MPDKLSLEQMLAQAAGDDPTPAPTPDPDPAPAPAPDPEPTPDPTPAPAPAETPQEDKPNPVKELRDRYNAEKAIKEKMQNAVKRFTDGDYTLKLKDFRNDKGELDYDALTQALDEEDTKKAAADKGLSPEVQKEIERIEREKIELDKERLKVGMERALTELQIARNLKTTDVNNFFKDAVTLKKNPYQWIGQGGNLEELYFLVYKDRIIKEEIDKALSTEKEKWEAQGKRTNPPAPNPANPKTDPGKSGEGLSLSELLLAAAKK